jgi:hypothetical protein
MECQRPVLDDTAGQLLHQCSTSYIRNAESHTSLFGCKEPRTIQGADHLAVTLAMEPCTSSLGDDPRLQARPGAGRLWQSRMTIASRGERDEAGTRGIRSACRAGWRAEEVGDEC